MFGCRLGFSGSADRMTLSVPNPVSRSKYSFKANISQTMHPIYYIFCSRLVFLGSPDPNGATTSSIISEMAADGHLGMTPLSRVSWHQLGFLVVYVTQLNTQRAFI